MIYLAIAALVFALSGVLSMAGLGAAFIFVPLFYWLGVPLGTASSTALLLNVVSLSFASVTYWRAGLVNWRLGTLLAPHAARHVLLGLLAAFLVFSGAMMLFYRRTAPPRARSRRAGAGAGGRVSAGHLNLVLLAVAVTMAAAGSLAGSRLMTTRISAAQLKRIIGVLLWAIAAQLTWSLA
jgi:uncharacterized protein